jgi:gas vesicle protein
VIVHYYKEINMKISAVLVTSLFVAAAGAITAILFAPDKGKKTREKLAKRGQEYKEYVVDNYNDLVETVAHPFENVVDQTERLSKKAIDKAGKLAK